MKKIVILCLAFVLLCANASFASGTVPVYQNIVPLQYPEIVSVNANSFVVKTGNDETTRYSLYSMYGECILSNELDIQFTFRNRSSVMVKRDGGWGVFSETGECLVPCKSLLKMKMYSQLPL